MSDKGLDAIDAQIERLKAKRAQKIAKLKHQDRKRETRMKILLGACVMEMIEKDPALNKRVKQSLDSFLVREHDRELWSLKGTTTADEEPLQATA